MTIGDRIKARREFIGISQAELAAKTRIPKQTLYKYEMNIITNIHSSNLALICKALDVSPSFLMGWDDPPKDTNSVALSEFEHIQKYRALDPHGKEMVDFTLQKEWERSTLLKTAATPSIHNASTRDL